MPSLRRRAMWVVSLALFLATCLWSYATLPDNPVTHFGNGGMGDGSMSREANLAVSLALGVGSFIGLPLLMWLLVRRFPAGINIPNREYWLAPGRVANTQRMLVGDMLLFAAWVGLYVAASEVQIVVANTRRPPHLGVEDGVMLAVFLVGVVGWVVSLFWRYGQIPRGEASA